MKVKIPFLAHFKEPMLNGRKTWTSRSKRYGKVEDEFDAFGKTFVIEGQFKAGLRYIAEHWDKEGCNNKEEFLALFQKIHPRKPIKPDDKYWIHIFRMKR